MWITELYVSRSTDYLVSVIIIWKKTTEEGRVTSCINEMLNFELNLYIWRWKISKKILSMLLFNNYFGRGIIKIECNDQQIAKSQSTFRLMFRSEVNELNKISSLYIK